MGLASLLTLIYTINNLKLHSASERFNSSLLGPCRRGALSLSTFPQAPRGPVPLARLEAHKLHEAIRAHGLGSLQGEAESPAPDELRQNAQGPGDAEQHRVVVHLLHAIVLRGEEGWGTSQGNEGLLGGAGCPQGRAG